MEHILIIIVLMILGLMFGSFAGASVWRLRARQLMEDKKEGEPVDEKELKRLSRLIKKSIRSDRSQCLSCHHALQWYDLVPVLSWLSTKGRCRYCQHRIGYFEPLMEIGMASFFVGSFLLWPDPLQTPFQWLHLILWLIAGVVLVIQFAYDAKWFLLPDSTAFVLIGVSAAVAATQFMNFDSGIDFVFNLALSLGVLSGLYYALWIISKGQWIGFGDIKLGIALALLLVDWKLALLALFLANLIGTLIVLPGIMRGKVGRMTRLPFGPLLILGTVGAKLFGPAFLVWYGQLLF